MFSYNDKQLVATNKDSLVDILIEVHSSCTLGPTKEVAENLLSNNSDNSAIL